MRKEKYKSIKEKKIRMLINFRQTFSHFCNFIHNIFFILAIMVQNSPILMKCFGNFSNLQEKYQNLLDAQISWDFATNILPRAQRGGFKSVDQKNRLCPSVRPCVCTLFPYCDFATFHFLFGYRRNRRFLNKKWASISLIFVENDTFSNKTFRSKSCKITIRKWGTDARTHGRTHGQR